jgi:hypothetical protein
MLILDLGIWKTIKTGLKYSIFTIIMVGILVGAFLL